MLRLARLPNARNGVPMNEPIDETIQPRIYRERLAELIFLRTLDVSEWKAEDWSDGAAWLARQSFQMADAFIHVMADQRSPVTPEEDREL